jgi:hypothetical protein
MPSSSSSSSSQRCKDITEASAVQIFKVRQLLFNNWQEFFVQTDRASWPALHTFMNLIHYVELAKK